MCSKLLCVQNTLKKFVAIIWLVYPIRQEQLKGRKAIEKLLVVKLHVATVEDAGHRLCALLWSPQQRNVSRSLSC